MATKSKSRSRKSKKRSSKPLVSPARKAEVLGLIILAVALLLSLAVLTYAPADAPVAQAFGWGDLLPFSGAPNGDPANALGPVGAVVARALVPGFLGYLSLTFTLLLGVWGYALFRHRRPRALVLSTALLFATVFIVAGLVGWFGLALEADLLTWSGAWGQGLAGWMQRILGTVGSFVLLLVLLAVALLLVIDRDVQKTLDRVEDASFALRDGVADWWAARRERGAEQRAALAAERDRRKNEREARRRQRERERAEKKAKKAKKASPPPAGPAKGPAPPAPARPAPTPQPPPNGRLNDRFRDEPAPTPAPRPVPKVTPPADPPPARPGDPELHVQERKEEQKAAEIHREADLPQDLPFEFPPLTLLDTTDENEGGVDYAELEENKQILLDKLETYKIEITAINAIVGPTVTLYELTPAPGVKISKITALEDDLAMAMAARGIRMIAPIPGKSAIGVEIPNRHRELVRIRDLLETQRFADSKAELPVAIGKSIEGEVFIEDLAKMPHLLIAGATGSGKSVGVNTLIAALLYACPPSKLKFVMIDPKKIELQQYARVLDHYVAMPSDFDDPIITDFMQALDVLRACEREMEWRYDLLAKATVRGLKDYNKKVASGALSEADGHRVLPYIVVIVDELADLMMTAGKEIEGPIARLAQMARAVGIHLVLATQRPSVDVITGLIKANFPSRIAFQVASKVDSRTILDQNGAEGLVGNGDLLYMSGSRLLRLQGAFISVDEVDEITHFIAEQPGAGPYVLPDPAPEDDGDTNREAEVLEDTDDLFEEAARIIVRSQQGSVSLLQRKLSVGYTRAARIVDQLEDAGIVGPFEGSKARAVLIEDEVQLDAFLNPEPTPPPADASTDPDA